MARQSAVTTVLEFDTDLIAARAAEVAQETDEDIMERLKDRFTVLHDMTKAVRAGDVRAMILTGPPGVGKSFGVEQVLAADETMQVLQNRPVRHQIVKGALSAVGLYAKLYEFSDENNVLVFDDADNIFFDDTSLNLLKAALDTSDKRFISWNSDSRLLRSEGIPDRFEFKGSIIFISNIKFAHVRSKKLKDHLTALESRCHYIDLEMDTQREKILRIKQVIRDTGMLDKYDFEETQKDIIIKFVEDNKDKLRELSLRTVIKTADLCKAFPNMWEKMATTTLMRR